MQRMSGIEIGVSLTLQTKRRRKNAECQVGDRPYWLVHLQCVAILPVIATCIYAQPECINFIVNRWKYIQYPPQAVSREEYYEKMRAVAKEDK